MTKKEVLFIYRVMNLGKGTNKCLIGGVTHLLL